MMKSNKFVLCLKGTILETVFKHHVAKIFLLVYRRDSSIKKIW